MKRIPSLDGFRAISILLVLMVHARMSVGFPLQYQWIALYGAVGVTVFFVISGFLITTLLLNEEAKTGTIDIKAFYVRRAFRILPVALLYITIVSVWRNFEPIGLKNSDIAHALTFTINFVYNRGSWFIGHFWTLSVEEQFYLIWPASFLFFRKHLKIILYVFIAYSCFARIIEHRYATYTNAILAPYFSYSDSIMIGAFGGILLFENPDIIKKKLFNSYWVQLASVIVIAMFLYFPMHGKAALLSIPFGNTVISVAILLLIMSYITPQKNIVYKLLNSRILVHIGILSYSIYIWQQFFITGDIKFIWRTFPLNMLIIYLVSLASYFLWEQPFLKLKKRFQQSSGKVV